MKYFSLILLIFLNGCLYVNERGVSTYLYDKCHEYYDADGVYHNDCDDTLTQSALKEVKSISNSVISSTKSLIGLENSTNLDKNITKKEQNTANSKKVVKRRKCKLVCTKKAKCKCKKKRKCANKDR